MVFPNDRLRLAPAWITPAAGKSNREVQPVIIVRRRSGSAINELWRLAGAVPSLDQRFAENKNLFDFVSGQQLITFSRQSDKTVINSAGQIATVPAGEAGFEHNPFTGESLGVLPEKQRIQLLELTDVLATQAKTVAANVHTLSFYGTGTIVLSGAHIATVVGNGAYPVRTVLTFTPTAGLLTLTITGVVQFGQLEPDANATSYIPNTGTSQVTCAADVISITDSAFSGFYPQNEMTAYIEFTPRALPSLGFGLLSIDDGTANERLQARINPGGAGLFIVRDGGSPQASFTTANQISLNVKTKLVISAAVNNFRMCLNGGSVASDTSGTMPTATQVAIGLATGIAGSTINGPIARIAIWPNLFSDTTMQDLAQ